jgi:hypothetical protein
VVDADHRKSWETGRSSTVPCIEGVEVQRYSAVGKTVLVHRGTIITGSTPPVDAMAVRDGWIVALGDEARDAATNARDTVDLDGGTVVPGFRDGHVHPVSGGREELSLNLAGLRSVDDVLATVGEWVRRHPDGTWIRGDRYDPSILPAGRGDARWLDTVCPDRPLTLYSADHHMVWANSAAMRVAGIDAATPEPPLGTIVRRGDGSPSGTFLEWGAIELLEAHMPSPPAEVHARALRRAMVELGAAGVVWAQDAAVGPELAAVYVAGAHAGVLTCRINLAWTAQPRHWVNQRDEFVAGRAAIEADPVASEWLTASTVKFFADGVIEGGTGFLLEAYDDAPHSCGLPNWSPEGLAEAVRAFDADGFQIHVHAIGDGGVRMALDAIEHAARLNGPRDRRPVIAHTQLVDPTDRPRFAALGVIANFEPLWACLDPVMEGLTLPRLGPSRSALQYPIATLADLGTRISFGSDWPVSSLRPLDGLAVAVTRQTPDGRPADGWLPDERVPIAQALRAYSAGTAFQAYDDRAGELSVGRRADFCVLDADITQMAGREISDVGVRQTWVAGRLVHDASNTGGRT